MNTYSITKPQRALARRAVRLDNVALVPASLLPFKEQWQAVANRLPRGSVLLCIPTADRAKTARLLSVARSLRDKGIGVRAVAAESFFR